MVYIVENAGEEIVKKLTSKEDLLSTALDIEDYFDNSSLYVFDNWIKGELVDGPIVKKYWIDITLKYPYHDMPDPTGGLRLTQNGTKITYRKAYEKIPKPIKSPSDYEPGTRKPKMQLVPIWLVNVKIPRRFINAVDQELLDTYADELDDSNSSENIEATQQQSPESISGGV